MSALKVLIVEDEMLIAMMIEDLLIDLGFEVVGPAGRLQPALALANSHSFDFAVLDVNLADERSFPVADVLRQKGIPFIFATGYGTQGLEAEYQDVVTLQKPFDGRQLKQAIATALAS